MKKIILSSLVVIAVAVIAVGVTYAYFTTTTKSENNTFKAGKAEISLNGATSRQAVFNLVNLVPGDTQSACVTVRNSGNIDLIFRGYIEGNVIQTPGFSDKLNVKVKINPSQDCGPLPGNLFGGSTLIDYSSPAYDGPLTGIINAHPDGMDNVPQAFEMDSQVFKPGQAAVYKVEVTLPIDTGNEWQEASFVGNLIFEGAQFKNQTSSEVHWN